MIVKNEEKNIETALGWAKPVAYEQIVVDTGSTDKTVEIAEKLGARVFHFEWIKDFAAAKNFAIDQATGDWIAFLDADEYFSPEDTQELMEKLQQIEDIPQLKKDVKILRMPWVQLDDEKKAFAVYKQSRIFRNTKEIRYHGKIHESLSTYEGLRYVDEISIMHTGYARSSFEETSKLQRNIELLRTELEEKPDDMLLKAYLADSLNNKARLENPDGTGEDAEANILFKDVIYNGHDVVSGLRKKAYIYFIIKDLNDKESYAECEQLIDKGLNEFNDDLDLLYFQASLLNNKELYDKAWEKLENLEKLRTSKKDQADSVFIAANPGLIYEQMLKSAQGSGDVDSVIKYATIVLMLDKTKQSILSPYIYTLKKHGTTNEEITELLGNVYNLSDPGDLLMVARAAKGCGELDFAQLIIKLASEIM